MELSGAIWREEFTFSALDERERLEPLYLDLDPDQGRQLALRAITALEGLSPFTEDKRYAGQNAMQVLGRVACFAPQSLTGLHDRMLEAGVHRWSGFYQGERGVMFRGAGPNVRDRLLAIADASADYFEMSAALHTLAWMADDTVSKRFFAWTDREAMTPGWWALWGGWQLEEQPPPRCLTAGYSYRLEAISGPSPVRVMVPADERCRRCNTVLAVLFDLDLTDPLLGDYIGGNRLRILTCVSCGLASHFFTNVDLDGDAGWSDLNEPAEGWGEVEVDVPRVPLGLGRAQRTPYEAMAFEDHRSQLFGHPTWVQNPEYPQCPRCEQLMLFVGQLDTLSELPLWEGMIYAFVDSDCGLAATCYQQT